MLLRYVFLKEKRTLWGREGRKGRDSTQASLERVSARSPASPRAGPAAQPPAHAAERLCPSGRRALLRSRESGAAVSLNLACESKLAPGFAASRAGPAAAGSARSEHPGCAATHPLWGILPATAFFPLRIPKCCLLALLVPRVPPRGNRAEADVPVALEREPQALLCCEQNSALHPIARARAPGRPGPAPWAVGRVVQVSAGAELAIRWDRALQARGNAGERVPGGWRRAERRVVLLRCLLSVLFLAGTPVPLNASTEPTAQLSNASLASRPGSESPAL